MVFPLWWGQVGHPDFCGAWLYLCCGPRVGSKLGNEGAYVGQQGSWLQGGGTVWSGSGLVALPAADGSGRSACLHPRVKGTFSWVWGQIPPQVVLVPGRGSAEFISMSHCWANEYEYFLMCA